MWLSLQGMEGEAHLEHLSRGILLSSMEQFLLIN